jgi:hypothetical protein
MAGLPIPVQSISEILADKMVAFAYRERRIKPRDVWDILWLKQQGVEQRYDLLKNKLEARHKTINDFIEKINSHLSILQTDALVKQDFHSEMSRFLPIDVSKRTLGNEHFWPYLMVTINDEVKKVSKNLSGNINESYFDMKM